MTQPGFEKSVSVKTTASTTYNILPGTSASLSMSGDVLDDTDFRSTGWRSRARGLKDWSVSATSNYEPANAGFAAVRTAWLNDNRVDVQYLPNGTNGYQGTAHIENFSHSGDVGGLEQVDISLQADGPLTTV